MRALIIESSRMFQSVLEAIYTRFGFEVIRAASGEDALEIFSTTRIDAVCLSFYLSDMDGLVFVSKIRAQKAGETTPLVMITSRKSQEATAKSLRDGVTEIFRKSDLTSLEQYLRSSTEYTAQNSELDGCILLIDDDFAFVSEIKKYFLNTKLELIHYTFAEEAAQIAKAAEFDLIMTSVILDSTMPLAASQTEQPAQGRYLTGMSLIREIREINDRMKRVPVLAISEIENPSQKLDLLRAGANDFIQKPVLMEELGIRIKNLLTNKKLFDQVEFQKKQLEELAARDHLTGLYNRHYLAEVASKAVCEACRYKHHVSLMVVDLDHFKSINDTYGHSTGDTVLKDIADLLLRSFRGSDTPVRFGGEEFVILLTHCSGKDAINRANYLRRRIQSLKPSGLQITASIGVSEVPLNANVTFEDLFSAADEAVYRAKKNGRNLVVFQELSSVCNRRSPEEDEEPTE